MTKTIKVGKKDISFTSNGATPLFYKQLFHKDLMKMLNSGDEIEIAGDNVPELAFIMAKQYDQANMMALTTNMYIEWLSLFEPLDLILAGGEIVNVYLADSTGTEEPKKKGKGAVKE